MFGKVGGRGGGVDVDPMWGWGGGRPGYFFCEGVSKVSKSRLVRRATGRQTSWSRPVSYYDDSPQPQPRPQNSKSRSNNTLISRLVGRTGEADGRRVHR